MDSGVRQAVILTCGLGCHTARHTYRSPFGLARSTAGGRPGQLREHGVDIDMPGPVYAGERSHVVDYSRAKRWDVDDMSRTELFGCNNLDVPAVEDDDPLGEIIFISGALTS